MWQTCSTGLWLAEEVRWPDTGLWLVEAGQDRSQAVWWSRGCRDSCQTPVLSPHPLMGNIDWAIIFICCVVLSVVMTSPAEMIGEKRYLMLIVILITFKLLHTNTVTITVIPIQSIQTPWTSYSSLYQPALVNERSKLKKECRLFPNQWWNNFTPVKRF